MVFSRQEFLSGLPFSSPGDLPDPGIEPGSRALQPTCNVGELGSIPGLGRSPGEGTGYQLWYSGLENSMGSIVLGVTKSWTLLTLTLLHCKQILYQLSHQGLPL